MQADNFDLRNKDISTATKVNSPYHVTKVNQTLTNEELAIQNTQYSLETGKAFIVPIA